MFGGGRFRVAALVLFVVTVVLYITFAEDRPFPAGQGRLNSGRACEGNP